MKFADGIQFAQVANTAKDRSSYIVNHDVTTEKSLTSKIWDKTLGGKMPERICSQPCMLCSQL